MRGHSPEQLQDAAGLLGAASPLRAIGLLLLAWAIGSTLLVGGLGAWVAMRRRWRGRD